MSFFGELRRRNVVKVAVAYAIVGWLLIEVSSVLGPALRLPDWSTTFVAFALILGFPIALILSWAYELTPDGMKKSDEVEVTNNITHATGRRLDFAIIGALVLALGFVVYNYVLQESADVSAEMAVVEPERSILPNSVAVLPFENLSLDPEDAFFATGIHEEVLNQLAKLSQLNVIARTSMMQYAAGDKSIPQVAEELNVETVMEGSVRYADGRVLVTAQLIDPTTNAHLWSESYNREFSDVFAIQSNIAMNIANALEVEFSLEEQESIEEQPTDSLEAYGLYLRALSTSSNEALSHLDRAIELDAEFALAYSVRARIYTQNLLGITGANPAEAAEFERLSQEDAERALELDPTLGQAHGALAAIHYANWRGTEAEDAFERAYELTPDADLAMEYGRFKRYRGEYEDAIRLQRRAYELDPNNFGLYYQMGLTYNGGGYHGEADAIFRHLAELDPADAAAHLQIGRVAAHIGNHEEAVRELQLAESLWEGIALNAFRVGQLIVAYSQAGSGEDALRLLDALQDLANDEPVGHAIWARAYLAVGDNGQALEHLTIAVAERASTDLPTLSELVLNSWGNPVLDEPEFQNLLSGLWE